MKKIHALTTLALAAALSGPALAQMQPVPANVVQLSASGQVEVAQDWLMISLNTRKEGADAASVQAQLKAALESALAVARPAAREGQMAVRTGSMGLQPRYNRDGKITGWQGSTELVLEGTDFTRITTTAGQIQTLTLGNVAMGLSREAQRKLEADAQALAIEAFKRKADEVAKGFGFTGYSLREVSVSGGGQPPVMPYPRMMAMEAKAAMADAPVPVEAGKSTVSVTVNGSIQLK